MTFRQRLSGADRGRHRPARQLSRDKPLKFLTRKRRRPLIALGLGRNLLNRCIGKIRFSADLAEVGAGPAERDIAYAAREGMPLIEDQDFATYCGRIGNLFSRHGRCPPFRLHDAARGWMAREIPLWHCIDVIERYLAGYGRSCPSGSGDHDFVWLSGLIETSWHDRSFAKPPRPTPKHSHHHDWLDEYGVEEPSQRPGRRATFGAAPKLDSKHDSFEPDRAAVRQRTAGAVSPVGGTRSISPQKIHPERNTSNSSGPMPAPSRKKIDTAVDWLRAELATGERPAAEVEANALCAGIAPRTYDRARKCLGVTSRRIGFGRWARYMIALPTVHGTPREGVNKVGVACPAPLSGNSKRARDVGQARKE
jgi:hypothetical protein